MNELLEDLPGEDTLDRISENGVFNVLFDTKQNIILEEACDNYFRIELDKKMCEDISHYFGELSKRLQGVDENE